MKDYLGTFGTAGKGLQVHIPMLHSGKWTGSNVPLLWKLHSPSQVEYLKAVPLTPVGTKTLIFRSIG